MTMVTTVELDWGEVYLYGVDQAMRTAVMKAVLADMPDPKDAYEKPLVEGEVPPSVEEPTDADLEEDDAPDPVEE